MGFKLAPDCLGNKLALYIISIKVSRHDFV